ncbi:hypothetical protein D9M70_369710 [compost metagenome]
MVKASNSAWPSTASTKAKLKAATGETRPLTTGRFRVRAMIESMRRSTTWFTAAAAPAQRPMPRLPNSSTVQGTPARVARNMPTSEVINISTTTLGLVSSR